MKAQLVARSKAFVGFVGETVGRWMRMGGSRVQQ